MKKVLISLFVVGVLFLGATAVHAQYDPYQYQQQYTGSYGSGYYPYNYTQGGAPYDYPVPYGSNPNYNYQNGYQYPNQYPYGSQYGYQYPYQYGTQYPYGTNQYGYGSDQFGPQAGDPVPSYVSKIDNDNYQIIGSNFGAYEQGLDEITVFGQTANILYWSNNRITFVTPFNLSLGSYEVRLRKFERPYGYYPDKIVGRIEVGTNTNTTGQVLGAYYGQDDETYRQQLRTLIATLQQQVANLIAQIAARVGR